MTSTRMTRITRTTWMTRTVRMTWMTRMTRISAAIFDSPFYIMNIFQTMKGSSVNFVLKHLRIRSPFFQRVSITGNSDSLVSDKESRTLRKRVTDAHFSCVPAHVTVVQDISPTRVTLTQECVEYSSLHFFKVILSSHVPSSSSECSKSISFVSVYVTSYTLDCRRE